ncbi:hypothetical protein DVB69_06235 [Sporosarcina sp. BI001-red]|uniref:hypothetical protein n=1 Tax=Sporosarcina sp. BI001-red TaxID=2282866 RepID=UPI000E21F234|nr:hypothetical protein [Sporosarcina sp. BI001-red]REB08723.1 hypothetical protein DVB69_06235 [Sporosarcina sp. BI001-red]
MTHEKNKITEEYKRQKIFPNKIGRSTKSLTPEYRKDDATYHPRKAQYPAASKEIIFHERLELINLRKENHRMKEEIEILMQTIMIMGSKMNK